VVTVNPLPTPAISGNTSGCSGIGLTSQPLLQYLPVSMLSSSGTNALKLSGTVGTAGASYYYDVIATPNYTFQTGDVLEYDIYLSTDSPSGNRD